MENYYLIKKQTLQQTADAIRERNGFNDKIDPEDFGFWIYNIQGSTGDQEEYLRQYVQGDIGLQEVLNLTHPTSLAPYFARGNEDVETISSNSIKTLGAYSLDGCANLNSVSLPNCTKIERNALNTDYCSAIVYCEGCASDVDVTTEKRIHNIILNAPKLTSIGDNALRRVIIDSALDWENLTYLGSLEGEVSFSTGKTTRILNVPNLLYLGNGWIDTTGTTILIAPKLVEARYTRYDPAGVEEIESSTAYTNLQTVDLTDATNLSYDQFVGCKKLRELILRGNDLVDIDYSFWGEDPSADSCFYNTPILHGAGFIFVQPGLVEEYRNHQVWSALSSQIIPIGTCGIQLATDSFKVGSHSLRTLKIGYIYGFNWSESITVVCTSDDYECVTEEGGYINTDGQLCVDIESFTAGATTLYISIQQGNLEASETIHIEVIEGGVFDVLDISTIGDYGFAGDWPTVSSTNQSIANSVAESIITFEVPYDGTLHLDWYIEAESCCDKGSISELDSNVYPTSQVCADSNSSDGTSGRISLPATAGEHYIYLKYRKDGSVDRGSDTFTVTFSFE